MFFYPTGTAGISTIISCLKDKSPGIDNWSVELIKCVGSESFITPVLSYIVSLSMQTGVFPDKLELALVVPIFKKETQSYLETIDRYLHQ